MSTALSVPTSPTTGRNERPGRYARTDGTARPPRDDGARDVPRLFVTFLVAAALGLAGAALYARASAPDAASAWAVFGGALLIAGAFALLGSLLGFVFAIPRSRQDHQAQPAQAVQGAEARPVSASRRPSDYAANTNLEQISDWLTKILVGAGLVQLGELPGLFSGAAAVLASSLLAVASTADPARPKAIALSLMMYFISWGFLFTYLVTRVWLPKALTRAEHEDLVVQDELERDLLRLSRLRAVERRVYDHLYEPPPGGYTKAIQLVDDYLAAPEAERSALLWTHLACAYGQQHGHEKPVPGSDAEVKLRNSVRQAVAKALSADPSMKPILKRVYDGTIAGEDDLASLAPDTDLDRLLD